VTERARIVITMSGAIALLVASAFAPPVVVLNLTSSVPRGLYLTSAGALTRGDQVLILSDLILPTIGAPHHLTTRGPFLIKVVAGVTGDRACRYGPSVWVSGHIRVWAKGTDRFGRLLPTWRGCSVLGRDDVMVFGTHPSSFDSRYFGPIPINRIRARVIPIWVETVPKQ
jgi:type IV secretory pathway protease TraF